MWRQIPGHADSTGGAAAGRHRAGWRSTSTTTGGRGGRDRASAGVGCRSASTAPLTPGVGPQTVLVMVHEHPTTPSSRLLGDKLLPWPRQTPRRGHVDRANAPGVVAHPVVDIARLTVQTASPSCAMAAGRSSSSPRTERLAALCAAGERVPRRCAAHSPEAVTQLTVIGEREAGERLLARGSEPPTRRPSVRARRQRSGGSCPYLEPDPGCGGSTAVRSCRRGLAPTQHPPTLWPDGPRARTARPVVAMASGPVSSGAGGRRSWSGTSRRRRPSARARGADAWQHRPRVGAAPHQRGPGWRACRSAS